jgi:hypothetical protein
MAIDAIAVGYLALGAAVALGLIKRLTALDAVLVTLLWPLYGPLVLLGRDRGEDELLGALRRAAASPLAVMLPDQATARALAHRLRVATGRLVELDLVLARPDFDPGKAEVRAAELAAGGQHAAATTAKLRVRTLGQLAALRQRYRAELEEVRELIAQLVAQAELLRLDPEALPGSAELVRELIARVEGLGELFDAEQYTPELGRWT